MATYYRNHELNRSDRVQIGACQAFVQRDVRCVRVDGTEYERPLSVCVSYETVVAAVDCEEKEIFLFPNCDYSVTTIGHVRRFARMHGFDLFAADIHKAWRGSDVNDELHVTRVGGWYVTACGTNVAKLLFGLDVRKNRARCLD